MRFSVRTPTSVPNSDDIRYLNNMILLSNIKSMW